MEFSQDTALMLTQSTDPFPVDFDNAWQWLGYSRKDHGKTALGWDSETKTWKGPFVEDFDFSRTFGKSTGGRSPELIMLTIDCFKSLGMMAGTERGKQVRRYFLECERQLKDVRDILSLTSLTSQQIELDALNAEARRLEAIRDIAQINPALAAASLGVDIPSRANTPAPKKRYTKKSTADYPSRRLTIKEKIIALSQEIGWVDVRLLQQKNGRRLPMKRGGFCWNCKMKG
ncbi:MAG: hypothetical protein AAF810_04880 [Cyanobacteria bacterium P01_D01_bin.36]